MYVSSWALNLREMLHWESFCYPKLHIFLIRWLLIYLYAYNQHPHSLPPLMFIHDFIRSCWGDWIGLTRQEICKRISMQHSTRIPKVKYIKINNFVIEYLVDFSTVASLNVTFKIIYSNKRVSIKKSQI